MTDTNVVAVPSLASVPGLSPGVPGVPSVSLAIVLS